MRLPSANLHVLPRTVDDDAGVFVEPLAAAFQILKQMKLDGKADSTPGRKWVTVLGDGRLGLAGGAGAAERGLPGARHRDGIRKSWRCARSGRFAAGRWRILFRGTIRTWWWIAPEAPAGFELAMQMVPAARDDRAEEHVRRGKADESGAAGDR